DNYCTSKGKKAYTKIKFSKKLEEIGIVYKKSHGQFKYNVPYADLKALADKNRWIHELDEFDETKKTDFSKCAFDDLNDGIDGTDQAVTQNNETIKLMEEIDKLREKIKQLESNNMYSRYDKLIKQIKDAGYLAEKKR